MVSSIPLNHHRISQAKNIPFAPGKPKSRRQRPLERRPEVTPLLLWNETGLFVVSLILFVLTHNGDVCVALALAGALSTALFAALSIGLRASISQFRIETRGLKGKARTRLGALFLPIFAWKMWWWVGDGGGMEVKLLLVGCG